MNKLMIRMVSIAIIFVGILLIYGCDGSNPSKSNPNAPRFDSTITPENFITDQFLSVSFSWSCIDPDSEEVKFDLYLGANRDLKLIAKDLTESSYKVESLEPGTNYYWYVIATDESGNITTSRKYEFLTIDSPVYPLSVGNNWEYDGIIELFYDYYDSTDFADTVIMSSQVTISSIDTLLDTLETYRFDEILLEGSSTYEGINYFNNNGHWFYNYAYENTSGTRVTPLSSESEIIYNFNGHQFFSIKEISDFIKVKYANNMEKSLQIIYEDPPVKSLKYRLWVNSQWTMRSEGNPWRIDKRVVDSLNITVPAGSFDSFQILWLYDINEDQEWDDDVSITDHISFYGLIKRDIQVIGMYLTDYNGDTLGVSNYYESWELTNYNVK